MRNASLRRSLVARVAFARVPAACGGDPCRKEVAFRKLNGIASERGMSESREPPPQPCNRFCRRFALHFACGSGSAAGFAADRHDRVRPLRIPGSAQCVPQQCQGARQLEARRCATYGRWKGPCRALCVVCRPGLHRGSPASLSRPSRTARCTSRAGSEEVAAGVETVGGTITIDALWRAWTAASKQPVPVCASEQTRPGVSRSVSF